SDVTLSNSNRTATCNSNQGSARSAAGLASGKWYVEFSSAGTPPRVGIANNSHSIGTAPGNSANSWALNPTDGNKINNSSATAYGAGWSAGDVLGLALDLDNGRLFFRKNGSWMNSGDPAAGAGAAFSGLTGILYLHMGRTSGSGSRDTTLVVPGSYTYSPPSGFVAGWGATAVDAVVVGGVGGIVVGGLAAAAASGVGAVAAAGQASLLVGATPAAVRGDGMVAGGAGRLAPAGPAPEAVAAVAIAGGAAVLRAAGRPAAAVGGSGAGATGGKGILALHGRPASAAATSEGQVLAVRGRVVARGLAAAAVAAALVTAGAARMELRGQAAQAAAGGGATVAAGPAALAAGGRPASAAAGMGGDASGAPGGIAIAGRAAAARGDAIVAAAPRRIAVAGRAAVAVGAVPAVAAAGPARAAPRGRTAAASATVQSNAVAAGAPARLAGHGRPAGAVGSAPLRRPLPAPGDLAALLADPQAELEWVALLWPWDADAGAVVPLRFSVRGMTTGPDASLPNAALPARLRDFQFRRALWQGAAPFGGSESNRGVLVLDALPGAGADAGLDHLAAATTAGGARRWHFRRRAAQILVGERRWGWDDLVPVFTGEIAEATFDGDLATFQLRDPLDRLDRPVQERAFTGDRVLAVSASAVAVGIGARVFALPNLVANGGFAGSLSGWFAGTGWTHAAGAAAKAAGVAATLHQDVATAPGQEYTLRAEIVRTGGTLQPMAGGEALGAPVAASGTMARSFFAAGSTTRIGFAADAGFAGTVDDVACRLEPRVVAGDAMRIARTADLAGTWMAGAATGWNAATGEIAVAVDEAAGAGTHADWSLWIRPYEGGAELAGKSLPAAFGTVRHAEPVELGVVQGLWLYRIADGPVRVDAAAGHGVFDGGVALASADAFPPAPGAAFVDAAGGLLWLASRPHYPLTVSFEAGLGAVAGRRAFARPGTHSWTVPPGVTTVRAKAWGGGGGHGGAAATGHPGGGGGFVDATLTVAPGDVLAVEVGAGGGAGEGGVAGGSGGMSGIADGGDGGLGAERAGGGGGGASGIRVAAAAVLGAPGGGGGSAEAGGGAGGGAAGADGGDGGVRHGDGGTAASGGGGGSGEGSGAAGTAGGTSTGGAGGGGSLSGGGGGGGGRRSGGGGGAGTTAGAGGGGAALATGGTTIAGSGTAPGGADDPDRVPGAGSGGDDGAAGGDGRVVLSWEPETASVATAAGLLATLLRDRLGYRHVTAGPATLVSIAADAANRTFIAGGGSFAALGIAPGDVVAFIGLSQNAGCNLTAVAVGTATLTVKEAIAEAAAETDFLLTIGELDGPALAALAAAAPQPQGVFVGAASPSGRELVDRILAGVGAWIDTTPQGLVTVGRYAGPAAVADHALGEADLDAVRRVPVAPALWRRRIGAARCWRPHGPAEIAAAAPDAVRAFLMREWREGVASAADVRLADPAAEQAFVESGLDRKPDADAEAARQLALAGPALLAFEAEASLRALAWRQGETVALTAPSVGLAQPRRLVIVAREDRMEGDGVTLTLLG
ncbi:MAG: hypothetical protein IT561_24230, partial [Alphaproteobacteria bacterium]|nr:hypothetical protein [Alphaproteobacteria bacterium]